MMGDKKQPTALRIHGDNIIECERALLLIADSFSAQAYRLPGIAPYLPQYEIVTGNETLFKVELFSGHGRWNVDLREMLQSYGAPLREAVDALVTRVLPDEQREEIILALEFCNALPAGNNAWQRNGRALTCAVVGVPYLFFAEIGGVELGAGRRIKAPRFPNPIVPFSYLTAGKSFDVVCLPVYAPSPSSSEAMRARFAPVFGLADGQRLVKCILGNASIDEPHASLVQRAMTIAEILAAQRKSVDTLRGEEWGEFLKSEDAIWKAGWLQQKQMAWAKKQTGKVVTTKTFRKLPQLFQATGCVAIGAKDIPLCLVPGQHRKALAAKLRELYGNALTSEFISWVGKSSTPLVVVWITGFKPRGDDSRPDRGLVPLARMLFGNAVDILSIVYGPAKPTTWKALRSSPKQLARQNGLWEAIVNLSDALLLDSATARGGAFALLFQQERSRFSGKVRFSAASPTNAFSEHDVDCALHLLFAHHKAQGVFEAMCNPPGGDWSGLSVFDFESGEEYRWTSLPRVSGVGGKRPDHVIQFLLEDGRTALLAIESKNKAADLEERVGARLKTYTRQLARTPPTISKAPNADWQLWQSRSVPFTDLAVFSGGAFCWGGEKGFSESSKQGKFDVVLAFEFKSVEQTSLLHVKTASAARFLLPKFQDLVRDLNGRLEIQVH
jgi:hypothetical protein